MKVYGPEFETFPAGPCPRKAVAYASVKEAKEAYAAFCDETQRYSGTSLDAWLYLGEPSGDEETYGYPDYPDLILMQGPKGGIQVKGA